MQHIQLLAVGTLKEDSFAAACKEYQKRLGAFCKLDIIEIPEARLDKHGSDAAIRQCIQTEGERILQKLAPKAYTVALCIEGKQLPSEQLASAMEDLRNQYSQMAFIIGGSHGLSPAVKNRAQLQLSMSKMTFPHQLARVMLLEQIYRAFSISAGSKYHK